MTRVSMSDLAYDIEQLYIEGLNPAQIAQELECPKSLVLDWMREQGIESKPFDKWSKKAQRRLIDDLVAE